MKIPGSGLTVVRTGWVIGFRVIGCYRVIGFRVIIDPQP